MKSWKLQRTVRLGITIVLVVYVLDLVTESSAADVDYPVVRDYNNEPRRRSKPREIRGFKPHSMSTAIGFGKRHSNNLQSSRFNGREGLIPVTDISERFPIEWLEQFFKLYPEIVRKIERSLVADEEKAPVLSRYKKNKSDNAYYYDD